MKLMYINTREIAYSLYEGRGEVILDDDDYETGEREMLYSNPVTIRVNVSVPEGEAWAAVFGTVENYDRIVITDDMECPIDENSVLWIDSDPDGDPYDYKVVRVAKYLNHIAYAVSKVVEHGTD